MNATEGLNLPGVVASPPVFYAEEGTIVAAAGFEDRTMALSSILVPTRCELGLVVYKDWSTNNRVEPLLDAYRSKGIDSTSITRLDYDRYAPDLFATSLRTWLEGHRYRRVYIDISTMSRLAIMIALDVCRELGKDVSLFYAEADTYGPSEEEYLHAKNGTYPRPSIQVYSGLGEVVRSRRLSSVALQGEPTALIAFMSMNEVLTQALIDCISPSRLFLINGVPPSHSWREQATAWIHEQLRREWPNGDNPCMETSRGLVPRRRTSTLDYTETATALLDLYWSNSTKYRIVLGPTGSKMQSVACYIVKGIHADIHIEYPTPESFLPTYSRGIGRCWTVEFGNLQHLLNGLRSQIMTEHLGILG